MGANDLGAARQAAAALSLVLMCVDVVIVADILSGGNLHRWGARQARAMYRWATEPMQREAEVRRQAAWLIWEAMQVLEEQP